MIERLYYTPKTTIIVISIVLSLVFPLYQIFTGGYLNYSKSYIYLKVTKDGVRDYKKHYEVVNRVLLGDTSSGLSFNIKCYLSSRSGIDVERFNVVAVEKHHIDNSITYIVSLPSFYIEVINSLESDLKNSLVFYSNEAYKDELFLYCDDIAVCSEDEVMYLDKNKKKHIEDYLLLRKTYFNISVSRRYNDVNKSPVRFLYESLFLGIVLGVFAVFLIRRQS